jgi:hypothetical protein
MLAPDTMQRDDIALAPHGKIDAPRLDSVDASD